MNGRPNHFYRRNHGFTLIELMVAMLLGLIVIAGVASVFLANLRSYHSNEALSDVQSNARIAFELMARDIRQAGATGCNSANGRVRNVLNNQGTDWWANWTNTLHGYSDASSDPALSSQTGVGAPIANSNSLELIGAGTDPTITTQFYDGSSAAFTLATPTWPISQGEIVMVCTPGHAAVLQLNAFNSDTGEASFIAGGTTPGNASIDLGYPSGKCSEHLPINIHAYCFPANSMVSRLHASTWYIGTNPLGGSSLYRMELTNDGGAPTATAQEMVRNVTSLVITYHQAGDPALANKFVSADDVTSWGNVDAVRVTFTLQSTNDHASTDRAALSRTFTATTTLRNRVN